MTCIRDVFRMFLSGWNTEEIAKELTDRGVKTREGLDSWKAYTIKRILVNEKYIGDALLQKMYSTESFPPVKKCNKGERPQYYVENTHPPIIDRESFDRVQKLLRSKRPQIAGKSKHQHTMKQKIICGSCGTFFRRAVNRGTPYWVCNLHNHGGDCPIQPVLESELHSAFLRMSFNLRHHPEILSQMLKNLNLVRRRRMLWSPGVIELNKTISDITSQSHSLSQLHRQGVVDTGVYISMSNQLAERLRQAKRVHGT